MIRNALKSAAFAAALAAASAAGAEPYVDYVPQKGFHQIVAVEVDPNHVDDYLAGLRRSQVPEFEVLKKRGIIDGYRIVMRTGYVKGSPNVLIEVHYPTAAVFDPDKARDTAVQNEVYAKFSKEQGKAAVAGYEKYRVFLDDALWTEVKIAQ